MLLLNQNLMKSVFTGNFDFTPEQVINKIIDLQERGEELPTEDSDTEETTPPKDPLLPAGKISIMKVVLEINSSLCDKYNTNLIWSTSFTRQIFC